MIKINLIRNMKKCSKCGKVKKMNSDNWQKSCQTKDGWQGFCKECRNKHNREYKEGNREEINKKQKEYYNRNREIVLEKSKRNYRDNIEWYRDWHKINNQKEDSKKYKREWVKEKYNSDIMFKLQNCFSSLIRYSLRTKGIAKNYKSSFDIVPYTKQELKEHLEKQFDDKMNWENYGSYWVIDHITPRCSFEFSSYEDEEFQKCWMLDNLRPLEKIENLRKGDRIEKGE